MVKLERLSIGCTLAYRPIERDTLVGVYIYIFFLYFRFLAFQIHNRQCKEYEDDGDYEPV